MINFWTALFLATLLLVVAIAVISTKFLFPYHRVLALTIYGIGWMPFLYSIWLKRQIWIEHQTVISSFFAAFWVHIVFGVLMLVTIYVFLVLFPVAKSPFIGQSESTVKQYLLDDQTLIKYLDERLVALFTKAEEDNIFAIEIEKAESQDRLKLQDFWVEYIEVMVELDLLKERYKTFYQLNALTQTELHQSAFKNGYAAFLAQHYYSLRLRQIAQNPRIVTYLNEPILNSGIEKDTFTMVTDKVISPDELLRLNTGRTYYWTINQSDTGIDVLISKYLNKVDDSLVSYADMVIKRPLDVLERNAFKLWFPIQKQSALQISYIRTTSRDYHINSNLISEYKNRFVPGDILLERREWHATNIGIPGYWTHSALYIGTIEFLDTYFEDLPELNGAMFSDHLEKNYPEVYEQMNTKDEDGFAFSVIESKRPGVILMSLEGSTNADSLAVLRVNGLEKSEQFKIIDQAFEHYGKPYDYDFNFLTDTALVCSELVFKAFLDIPKLSIETRVFNGRPIISPNDFAEQFANEFIEGIKKMELVLFLDGNEKTKKVTEKGVGDFITSWQRPKWHIAKDFIETN